MHPPKSKRPRPNGWHVVVNGEQTGPLLARWRSARKFSAGEIDGESYAWREGFGDWQRLAAIDDFRDLAAAAPPPDSTKRTGADDLFGGGDDPGAESAPGRRSLRRARQAMAMLFAGGRRRHQGGGGLFAQPPRARLRRVAALADAGLRARPRSPDAPAPAAAPQDKAMTGQRNESSVLFSLNNLQALALGGEAVASLALAVENRAGFANSQSEGSGLIDIRAMAASTLSSERELVELRTARTATCLRLLVGAGILADRCADPHAVRAVGSAEVDLAGHRPRRRLPSSASSWLGVTLILMQQAGRRSAQLVDTSRRWLPALPGQRRAAGHGRCPWHRPLRRARRPLLPLVRTTPAAGCRHAERPRRSLLRHRACRAEEKAAGRLRTAKVMTRAAAKGRSRRGRARARTRRRVAPAAKYCYQRRRPPPAAPAKKRSGKKGDELDDLLNGATKPDKPRKAARRGLA